MVSRGRGVGAQVSYVGCMLVFVAKEASVVVGESEANKRKNNVSIELAQVLPSYVGQGLLKCDGWLLTITSLASW